MTTSDKTDPFRDAPWLLTLDVSKKEALAAVSEIYGRSTWKGHHRPNPFRGATTSEVSGGLSTGGMRGADAALRELVAEGLVQVTMFRKQARYLPADAPIEEN